MEEPLMKDSDLELPYPYTENHRAGSTKFMATCFALSGACIIIGLAGLPAAFWMALGPIGLMALRMFLFDVIRNATHEAIRRAQADSRLDHFIAEGAYYARTHGMTPDDLKQRLHEVAEETQD